MPSAFGRLQNCQQFMRADFGNWARSKRGSQLSQEPARLTNGDCRAPLSLRLRDIFLGNRREGVRRCDAFGDAGFALRNRRIIARLRHFAGVVAPRARILRRSAFERPPKRPTDFPDCRRTPATGSGQCNGTTSGFLSILRPVANIGERRNGAQERTRTSTPLRAPAPEAGASTNSATWAQGRILQVGGGA